MKRISILSALLLMCAMTFAQQALWGGAPVVSPEIHDNNTVTFRLKAPKAGIHYSRTAETGTLQLHFPGRRTED